MTLKISTIVDYLQLERIEENIFRGKSRDLGTPQVYGGQVLGQAIQAAQHTVENRNAHSVHCYFLRRGDFNAPIIYEVDRSRDGSSFAARRVVAIQHGRPIFTMSASFQQPEEGLDHGQSIAMPPPPPGAGEDRGLLPEDGAHTIRQPHEEFQICPVDDEDKTDPLSYQWWIKTRQGLPDDGDIHRSVLAYISDLGLLGASLLPHGYSLKNWKTTGPKLLLASIDHALWFHRPFRVDEWLLYYMRPVSTSGARGLALGSIYDASGALVATTAQEGLTRLREDSPKPREGA